MFCGGDSDLPADPQPEIPLHAIGSQMLHNQARI